MTASRRAMIRGIGVGVASGGAVLGRSRASRRGRRGVTETDSFDPERHGFGFRNWSSSDPYFPTHDHERVSETEIRRALGRTWGGVTRRLFGLPLASLPSPLVSAIAGQLYVSANQFAAANGHCYGMTYAAQRYFERPEQVPLDRESASEFRHPEAPAGDPERDPVAQDVDVFQTSQLLDPYAWVGRRDLLNPHRIDYRAHLDAVTAAVDTFGSASISLMNSATYVAHEVLVYDYAREGSATRLSVYDPNFGARFYADDWWRGRLSLRVDPDADAPVERYTAGVRRDPREGISGYDTFVYNRWERLIAARNGPDEHPARERGQSRLRDQLLGVLTVTLDAAEAVLHVVDPDDAPVSRVRSEHMDRSRTDTHAMRSRYGPDPGTYRLLVSSGTATDYTLGATLADRSGGRLDASRSRSLDAGEHHEYRLTVPEGEADATLERAGVRSGLPDWATLAAGGAVAGAVGAGALGYAAGRSSDDE
ncbi:hypothetical protein ACFO0N_06785 [Halobium salinum]|uniref:Cysteine protease n=1 Tax=Halobium salinum TaxID=1364940 RepID=A0ABD5PAG4_9EURY|nr:hypothetical protein [Halobium salinum]